MSNIQIAIIGGFIGGLTLSTVFFITIKILKKLFGKKKPTQNKSEVPTKSTDFDVDLDTSFLGLPTESQPKKMTSGFPVPMPSDVKNTITDSDGWAVINNEAFKVTLQNDKFFGKRILMEKK